MAKKYWLMKNEPADYGWDHLVADGQAEWDGVRNYQARNNIEAMRKGHLALFYHSGKEKQVVGVMRVVSDPYLDPTDEDDEWLCVDVEPEFRLKQPVTLAQIKQEEALQDILLIKQSRLSVMPLDKEAFARILDMGGVKNVP